MLSQIWKESRLDYCNLADTKELKNMSNKVSRPARWKVQTCPVPFVHSSVFPRANKNYLLPAGLSVGQSGYKNNNNKASHLYFNKETFLFIRLPGLSWFTSEPLAWLMNLCPSLGEEDLVIHKMMPLSAYLMLRWGRERNPCSASLLLDSPSSCVWCCKRPDHCLAPALFCSRAAVWSQSLWGQERSQCAVENLTPWSFLRPGAAYSVTAQKLLPWPNLGTKWVEYSPLSFTKRVKFWPTMVKRRLDCRPGDDSASLAWTRC